MRPRISNDVLAVASRTPRRRRSEFQTGLHLVTVFVPTTFVLTATAVAQQETKDLSNATLEELGNVQVHSASKHMQSSSDAPSSVAVITADELGHTLDKHLDLSGSVYNAFNKKYFDPGRPEDPEDSIQQDGRNFRIKFTARF